MTKPGPENFRAGVLIGARLAATAVELGVGREALVAWVDFVVHPWSVGSRPGLPPLPGHARRAPQDRVNSRTRDHEPEE